MLPHPQGLLWRPLIPQYLGDGEHLLRGVEAFQPVLHSLPGPSQPGQHDGVARGLLSGLGEAQVLFVAASPLQHVEPGGGQGIVPLEYLVFFLRSFPI
jgi:hypothetical protein